MVLGTFVSCSHCKSQLFFFFFWMFFFLSGFWRHEIRLDLLIKMITDPEKVKYKNFIMMLCLKHFPVKFYCTTVNYSWVLYTNNCIHWSSWKLSHRQTHTISKPTAIVVESELVNCRKSWKNCKYHSNDKFSLVPEMRIHQSSFGLILSFESTNWNDCNMILYHKKWSTGRGKRHFPIDSDWFD